MTFYVSWTKWAQADMVHPDVAPLDVVLSESGPLGRNPGGFESLAGEKEKPE